MSPLLVAVQSAAFAEPPNPAPTTVAPVPDPVPGPAPVVCCNDGQLSRQLLTTDDGLLLQLLLLLLPGLADSGIVGGELGFFLKTE